MKPQIADSACQADGILSRELSEMTEAKGEAILVTWARQ